MTGENLLHWVDILVFVTILLVSIAIGIFFAVSGERQRTTKEFLMGNHKLRVLPVALSLYMSYASATLILGTSAEMYLFGTQQLMQALGSMTGYLISAFLIVPVLYPLKLVSQYQYHEMRFKSKFLRKLLSLIALLRSVFVTGVNLYSPAIALEAVTGLQVWVTVLCTGIVATIYTSIGGMKAVVWTDAFQAVIFFAGVLVVLILGLIEVGGFGNMWSIAEEGDRIQFFNLDLDYRARATLWNVCVGRMVTSFVQYGVGQSSIQRYTALPSMRAAKLSLLLNIPMLLLVYASVGIIGLVLYAYYYQQGCDPLRSKQISSPNQLLPKFIVDVLGYPGFPGMFIAVLFSGGLSSVSSSMSSVSAIMWKDFVEPLAKNLKEAQKALITKMIVVVFGLLSVGMAFLVQNLPGHITQISNAIMGSLAGATTGALMLGMFIPQGNWKGAVGGVIASLAMGLWMNVGQLLANPFRETLPTRIDNCTLAPNTTLAPPPASPEDIFPLYAISFNWFSLISSGVAVFVGIIVSFITGPQDPRTVDKNLVIPVFDKMCCCLPLCLRRVLRCGVPRDDEEEEAYKERDAANNKGMYAFDNKALHDGLEMGQRGITPDLSQMEHQEKQELQISSRTKEEQLSSSNL